VADEHVTRTDECRLLFLFRSDSRYLRYPVSQWKPFEATSVEEVDNDVKVHRGCGEHKLQYQGLQWKHTDGRCSLDRTTSPSCGGEQASSLTKRSTGIMRLFLRMQRVVRWGGNALTDGHWVVKETQNIPGSTCATQNLKVRMETSSLPMMIYRIYRM
jgi:hypothetical protein